MDSNPCVYVWKCFCGVQVTVLSKGSLIIVGVIMEISVSLTIGADDKKKNYLFRCFCSLISRPLATSRDFYNHVFVLPCVFFSPFPISVWHFAIAPCILTTQVALCVPEGCEFPIIIQCPRQWADNRAIRSSCDGVPSPPHRSWGNQYTIFHQSLGTGHDPSDADSERSV